MLSSKVAKKIIAIDGRPLQGQRTGVGRYVFELCKVLEQELKDVTFYVYTNRPLNFEPFSPRWQIRLEENCILRKLKPAFWLKYFAGRLVNDDHAMLFWGSASFLPNQLNLEIQTVLTVYDLNYLLVPETMTWTHRLSFRMFFPKDVKRTQILVTISQGTSTRLYGVFSRNVDFVVPPSADPAIFHRPTNLEIKECLYKYGINGSYFLAVATHEPRKNLDQLVDAYVLLRKYDGVEETLSLVLVGGSGWKNKGLSLKIANCSGIRQLGFIPDADLPALYAGSIALVFPSRYEGFGMPVLEARLSGAMVIATDIPEIREAGGSDIIYTESDSHTLVEAMRRVLADKIKPPPIQFSTWLESGKSLASIFSRLL